MKYIPKIKSILDNLMCSFLCVWEFKDKSYCKDKKLLDDPSKTEITQELQKPNASVKGGKSQAKQIIHSLRRQVGTDGEY